MDRALKTKFAIYSVCFVNLMYMLPAVAVSGMVAAFPQAGENTVLLVLTLPNLTSIPALLAAAFWLPRAPETQAGDQTGPEADRWDKPATAGLAAVGFCFAALYFITSTHLSLYIEGNGLGTAAMTGALTALGSVLSGLLAAMYGRLRRFTGPYTFALALLLLGAGYVLAALRVTVLGAVVCICGASMGMALFSPCLMLGFARCAGGRHLPTVTALVLTIVNVGYFVSPYLTGALGALLPGSGAAPVFLAAGLLALAGAAFLAARAAWKR